ncbi:tRNA preQ1(34) S-adenosylmethionine ribosyltransferase-isomerase QueA [uncultured Desulfuromonas sp.]|uniref:tRNA preQ1(34) S-adenosylmethionine ribosyltransferase-isomerase QueA n=1 Tax=uncultured Desulfuromonas sp. TaxID=181013 RepID=UPI002AAC2886|nr:tRNA preQ1(34) S-adenosylmethionine ribosyltransferase-isomerase QueA [uncultured Desulfuromonas sp.]
MYVTDFNYDLPQELIAQHPCEQRDGSRLMVLDCQAEKIVSDHFRQVDRYFQQGDVLVINDTRVIPARLLGHKESGGKVEVFLVRKLAEVGECWLCLTRASKGPRPGTRLLLAEQLTATVMEGGGDGYRHIRFDVEGDFLSLLDKIGRLPLPPYIDREPQGEDRERYQTTFSSRPGAVAAPTAGLHFTPEILDKLRAKGVVVCPLTLHVGLGTFLPVRVDNVEEHRMHAEAYCIPDETAAQVNLAKREGRRVIALGTTVTRTLEFSVDAQGQLQAGDGMTDMFIYPGYRFKIVDALLTNFHLPQSTLLMLVSALAGREFVLQAYRQAVEERYRFFSYGDCMLIHNVSKEAS